jgi:branched-chain amino acid transport system permease protein
MNGGVSAPSEVRKALLAALWFVFLTFPLVAVRVNTVERTIAWRWSWVLAVAVLAFFMFLLGRWALRRREAAPVREGEGFVLLDALEKKGLLRPAATVLFLAAAAFPLSFSSYQTSIMTTALMYVVLGLGLNIVVGLAGLLDLGYVAFYAVGAYTYALLHQHFGIGFWTALPLGGLMAALFGILLGFPVLRLRGDYLAIVTLGFGEIIRLILENWNEFSSGPSGIANIPRPSFFGAELSLAEVTAYMYYLMLALVIFTVFVVARLENSRIGRAWIALREDEVACQAMGIDKTRTKLTAFALGATWAGMMGVVFAAKTTFVNPASFTFLESAMILSIVVLGGMGSIAGVIIAALILILLPEYLRYFRAFLDFRMLLFGAIMVIMMVFRPEGIVRGSRPAYRVPAGEGEGETPP